jgi:hypothetical protein
MRINVAVRELYGPHKHTYAYISTYIRSDPVVHDDNSLYGPFPNTYSYRHICIYGTEYVYV